MKLINRVSYRIVLTIIFLIILLCGCGRNPLAPGGLLQLGIEQKNRTGFSSPHLTMNTPSQNSKSPGYYYEVTEIYFTIKKIEFTTDGERWIEAFNGNMEIEAKANSNVDFYVDKFFSVKPDEYHGIRIWIGDKVRMKANVIESYTGNIIDTVWKEVDDAGVRVDNFRGDVNPREFTTRTGLPYPFTVKPNRPLYILLWINAEIEYPIDPSMQNRIEKPILEIGGVKITEIKP
jgi:hypothetical protein